MHAFVLEKTWVHEGCKAPPVQPCLRLLPRGVLWDLTLERGGGFSRLTICAVHPRLSIARFSRAPLLLIHLAIPNFNAAAAAITRTCSTCRESPLAMGNWGLEARTCTTHDCTCNLCCVDALLTPPTFCVRAVEVEGSGTRSTSSPTTLGAIVS